MNTYDNVILTDCDGVLLNWSSAFSRWMERHGLFPLENTQHEYSIAKRYGITKAEKDLFTRMFNESAAIEHVAPLRDAMYYVDLLHRKHGFVFHAITSLSLDTFAGARRTRNLKNLFGPTAFEKYTYLDTGADKDEALAEYRNSGCIFVEDKVENALVGHKLGLNSVIFDHPYNHDFEHPDIPRVHSWKEIYEMVTGET